MKTSSKKTLPTPAHLEKGECLSPQHTEDISDPECNLLHRQDSILCLSPLLHYKFTQGQTAPGTMSGKKCLLKILKQVWQKYLLWKKQALNFVHEVRGIEAFLMYNQNLTSLKIFSVLEYLTTWEKSKNSTCESDESPSYRRAQHSVPICETNAQHRTQYVCR